MKHLTDAGLMAVLNHPEARLIAKANPQDRFNLVFFSVAENGIVSVFNPDSGEECKWINRFLDGRRDHNGNFHPFEFHGQALREICEHAYKILNLDVEWLYEDETEPGDDLTGWFTGYRIDVVGHYQNGTFRGFYDNEGVTPPAPTRELAKAELLLWIAENRAPRTS